MRRLEWLAVAMTLFAGGCVSPCSSGVCSSSGSLFNLPTPRFHSTETIIDDGYPRTEYDSGCGVCCSRSYPTFNKYCPWFDEWHTTSTAKRCANRILFRQQWQLKKLMPADYKAGFRQAFVDVAHGSDGELPAVPPPVYWNTHFRNDSGQRRAECWFAGYRAGAAMAAVQLAPMKRIAASYDWTVEKPRSPLVGGDCVPCGLVGQPVDGQLPNLGYPPMPGPQLFVPGQQFGSPQPFGSAPQFGPQQHFGPPPFGPQTQLGAHPSDPQPPIFPQQRFAPQQFTESQNFGPRKQQIESPAMMPNGQQPIPFQGLEPPGPATSFSPPATSHSIENIPRRSIRQGPGLIGPPEDRPAPIRGGLVPGHSPPRPPVRTNPAAEPAPPGGSLLPGFSGPGGDTGDTPIPPEKLVY